jgi:hypothetical protein
MSTFALGTLPLPDIYWYPDYVDIVGEFRYEPERTVITTAPLI